MVTVIYVLAVLPIWWYVWTINIDIVYLKTLAVAWQRAEVRQGFFDKSHALAGMLYDCPRACQTYMFEPSSRQIWFDVYYTMIAYILKPKPLPCIAVFFRIDDCLNKVPDPSRILVRLSRQKFTHQWCSLWALQSQTRWPSSWGFKVQGSEESMELQLNEHSECHGRSMSRKKGVNTLFYHLLLPSYFIKIRR